MRGQWLQPPQLDGTEKGFVSEMTFHLELNYSRGYIFKMWRTSHIITGPQRRKSYHVVFGSHKEISLARDTGAEGNGLMSVRQTGPVLHPLKQGSSKSQALWGTHWKLHYMFMAGGGRGWGVGVGGDTALIKSSLRNGATFSPRPERAKPDLAFSSH